MIVNNTPQNERWTDERLEKEFKAQFGAEGLDTLVDFATHSQEKFPHGGAPRSNYLVRFFIQAALGHPGTDEKANYIRLHNLFDAARNLDHNPIEAPSHRKLKTMVEPYKDRLNHAHMALHKLSA